MILLRRRNTVTPEMRAELARKLADAPTPEQVMEGLNRVTEAVIRLAETSVGARRPSEFWVDQVHDAVWDGGQA